MRDGVVQYNAILIGWVHTHRKNGPWIHERLQSWPGCAMVLLYESSLARCGAVAGADGGV